MFPGRNMSTMKNDPLIETLLLPKKKICLVFTKGYPTLVTSPFLLYYIL